MGKPGRKPRVEIAPTLPAKQGKKGKRKAQVPAVKPVCTKKQKSQPEKVVVVAKKDDERVMEAPEEEPDTSSSEDTSSSDWEVEEITPKSRGRPKISTQRVGFYRNCLSRVRSRQSDSRPPLQLPHAAETLAGVQAPACPPLAPPLPDTSLSPKKLAASSARNGIAVFSIDKKQKLAASKNTSAKAPQKTAVSSDRSWDEDSEKEDDGTTSKIGAKGNGAFTTPETRKPLSESSESESEESESDDDSEEIITKASTGRKKPQSKAAHGPTSKRKIESTDSSDSDSDYDAADDMPRKNVHSSLAAASGSKQASQQQQPLGSVLSVPVGESSQIRKVRGLYAARNLDKLTEKGKKKLTIDFSKERSDVTTPLDCYVGRLVLWLGLVARDVAGTPIRNWKTFTDAERAMMLERVEFYFLFTGTDKHKFVDFCISTMKKSLRMWRSSLKRYYVKKWLPVDEKHRRVPGGISECDWLALIAFFESDGHKRTSKTNSQNRSKCTIKHTTGTISFARFEHSLATKNSEGELIWPDPAYAWMMEHTKKTPEGRVYVDPDSEAIHEKIVSHVSTQQSTQHSEYGSAVGMAPTDVIFPAKHNHRTGRGSGFGNNPIVHLKSRTLTVDNLQAEVEAQVERRDRESEEQFKAQMDAMRAEMERERQAQVDAMRAEMERERKVQMEAMRDMMKKMEEMKSEMKKERESE